MKAKAGHIRLMLVVALDVLFTKNGNVINDHRTSAWYAVEVTSWNVNIQTKRENCSGEIY